MSNKAVVFCTMAEDEQGLRQVDLFIESLRKYGGAFSSAEVRIYLPQGMIDDPPVFHGKRVSIFRIPKIEEACRPYFFSSKVYCAADAEASLEQDEALLVWVDEDTLVLNEPDACALEPDKAAALCPVMHNRTGVAWEAPPGELWAYLDTYFQIEPEALFPVMAPADETRIRPYFNAGFMVLDPGCHLMAAWKEQFVPLCSDSRVIEMVARNPDDRIFLHQMVLAQVLLQKAGRAGIEILSPVYNYPLFFDELFPAVRAFNDLSEAVTARYDVYFRDPRSGWQDRLKGSPEKTGWLAQRLQGLANPST